MADRSHVRLLDADPDIGRYLTPDERDEAESLTVPVLDLPAGPIDMPRLLHRNGSFGAFVLDGMLARHLRVGDLAGMRILGPGDVVSLGTTAASMLLVESGCRAVCPVRLALLGRDVLVGAQRWPRLVAGLHARAAEQIERVAIQLAICQLPRVEDRLLALFWLLAESWGRVTPGGTVLPLALTHETLGALVGARRPTVTLALGALADRGAVLRQGRSWLLVERPAHPERGAEQPHAPRLLADVRSLWRLDAAPLDLSTHEAHDEMMATIERLRAQHRTNTDRIREGLVRARASRTRSEQLRERVREGRAIRARRAPSSG
jgi:CRP-like cAMP-binding protein